MDLNFDSATEIVLPVRIRGEDYVLREATGEGEAKFRNAQIACVRLDGDTVKAQSGLADTECVLVTACLYKGDVNVELDFVKKLPSRIVRKLFEEAKRISEIDQPKAAAPKGEPSVTVPGSN